MCRYVNIVRCWRKNIRSIFKPAVLDIKLIIVWEIHIYGLRKLNTWFTLLHQLHKSKLCQISTLMLFAVWKKLEFWVINTENWQVIKPSFWKHWFHIHVIIIFYLRLKKYIYYQKICMNNVNYFLLFLPIPQSTHKPMQTPKWTRMHYIRSITHR